MAATASAMLPLGTPLPAFTLPNAVDGAQVSSLPAGPQGTLVMFLCNHCPYVIHVRPALVKLADQAVARGVKVLAINSNSERTHPHDGPERMRDLALDEAWAFPFLFDRTQEVAKQLSAACTPDLFLFDRSGRLAYRGQFDDSRPGNGRPVTGADLSRAIDAVLAGAEVPGPQRPSIGCNIKWHPEPSSPSRGKDGRE